MSLTKWSIIEHMDNMEQEITLAQVLAARERRAFRQFSLLTEHKLPLVSFCMNIAGPVKNSPLIRRAFHEGLMRLNEALRGAGMPVVRSEQISEITGCEALLVINEDALNLKKLCINLEDEDRLGRLFDLDVLLPGGEKMEREALNCPPRPCLICGKPGKGCASRRLHPVEELRQITDEIMRSYFAHKDVEFISGQAVRALLYEVCTTPKPGLVDRMNSGSHRDMDIFTFMDSTAALFPYLRRAVSLGIDSAALSPRQVFQTLRQEGLRAERDMLSATGGVNTHKGAIFSLGTLCCAAGRLWKPEKPWAGVEAVLSECAALYRDTEEEDFAKLSAYGSDTSGGRLYTQHGIKGIRGELVQGLPNVLNIALPALRQALQAGASLEQAGCAVLIQLVAHVTDTNLIHRGGFEGQAWAATAAAHCSPMPNREDLIAFDRAMIERNLSPGGCADLLAITYFLHFCEAHE